MRAWLIMALLLQLSAASGQSVNYRYLTLDDALAVACKNIPTEEASSGRKELARDIKSAWYQLLYNIHKWQTLQAFQKQLDDLERVAALHYQAGEIDKMERSAFINKQAVINTSTAISGNEIDMSNNLLRQLLFTDEIIIPADTLLSIYQIDKSNVRGHSQGTQLELGIREDSLLSRHKDFILTKTIENKQLELDGIFLRLQYFNTIGLAHSETILRIAQAKFKTEDIDYLEFSESLSEAFDIILEYLETMNNYNQNAILLEYYAY
jgi:hypothetical protein